MVGGRATSANGRSTHHLGLAMVARVPNSQGERSGKAKRSHKPPGSGGVRGSPLILASVLLLHRVANSHTNGNRKSDDEAGLCTDRQVRAEDDCVEEGGEHLCLAQHSVQHVRRGTLCPPC